MGNWLRIHSRLVQAITQGQHGFEIAETEQAIQRAWAAKGGNAPEGIRAKKLPWQPFRDPARIWLNADKLPYPRDYEGMKDTFIARQAERYLEEHKDKPFALWVSFHAPHSPFDFPVDDRDRFDAAKFRAPRVGPEDGWQIPLIFRELSEADKQGIIAAYYTAVRFLDRNVGVVLEKLRALNLEESTYVVYSADHGYDLGHHGRFEKHCGYDPALRVPLIMRCPGHVRRGVVEDFTEHIDTPATILDVMETERLPVQHGQSLRPYLEGRRVAHPRDHIFSEYLENEEAFIRTERWKFIYCSGKRDRQDGYKTDRPTPGRYVRLYDLKTDPGEFTDVAARHPDGIVPVTDAHEAAAHETRLAALDQGRKLVGKLIEQDMVGAEIGQAGLDHIVKCAGGLDGMNYAPAGDQVLLEPVDRIGSSTTIDLQAQDHAHVVRRGSLDQRHRSLLIRKPG
jgi:choline-sulfatase